MIGYILIGISFVIEINCFEGSWWGLTLMIFFTMVPFIEVKLKAYNNLVFGILSYSFILQLPEAPSSFLIILSLARILISQLLIENVLQYKHLHETESAIYTLDFSLYHKVLHLIVYLDAKLTKALNLSELEPNDAHKTENQQNKAP